MRRPQQTLPAQGGSSVQGEGGVKRSGTDRVRAAPPELAGFHRGNRVWFNALACVVSRVTPEGLYLTLGRLDGAPLGIGAPIPPDEAHLVTAAARLIAPTP